MTVINKLSDRDNLIFEAIKIIAVNTESISAKELQWQLFQAGIMIKGSLLKQVLSVMKENGDLTHVQPVQKEETKA